MEADHQKRKRKEKSNQAVKFACSKYTLLKSVLWFMLINSTHRSHAHTYYSQVREVKYDAGHPHQRLILQKPSSGGEEGNEQGILGIFGFSMNSMLSPMQLLHYAGIFKCMNRGVTILSCACWVGFGFHYNLLVESDGFAHFPSPD